MRNVPAVNIDSMTHQAQVAETLRKIFSYAQFVMETGFADAAFFTAPRSFRVTGVREIHRVAGDDGGAVSLQIEKCTGTTAPGSGTNLLTNNSNAGFNLKGTANTDQEGSLVTTAASILLAKGDRLAVDFAGTLTSLAGVCVTVELDPV